MLIVAENTCGLGVGARLLLDAQQHRATPKLFTSTNLSNQLMQRLPARLGWQSAGIVYGLDDGDPELFFLAPGRHPAAVKRPVHASDDGLLHAKAKGCPVMIKCVGRYGG